MRKCRYNGRQTGPSPPFPEAMEEACQYIEQVVNTEMHNRSRFPLEWGGEAPTPPSGDGMEFAAESERSTLWRANVAASNCYEGTKEGVGFHSDALTYLGPYPTIASLSLGMHISAPVLSSLIRAQAPHGPLDCAKSSLPTKRKPGVQGHTTCHCRITQCVAS